MTNDPPTRRGWRLQDGEPVDNGTHAVSVIRERIQFGVFQTWLYGPHRQMLTMVTNGVRAMVMLLVGDGDAGEHAVDHEGQGSQSGYVLDNGQVDTYDNRDTIELNQALEAIRHLVDDGTWPQAVAWQSDRYSPQRRQPAQP